MIFDASVNQKLLKTGKNRRFCIGLPIGIKGLAGYIIAEFLYKFLI